MLTRSASRTTPTRMLVDALTGTGAAGHRTSSKTAAHTAAGGLTFEPRTSGYSRLAARQQAEDEGQDDAQDEAGGQGIYTTTVSRRMRMSPGSRGTLPITVSNAPIISSATPNTINIRPNGASSLKVTRDS